MGRAVIRVEKLVKSFHRGNETESVLRGIDLEIKTGEFVALVGPSGSGKSTLLHLLGCMDRPTSGRILFKGQNMTEVSDSELDSFRRQHLGFIFQTFNLMSMLTAEENVAISLLGHVDSDGERRRRAKEMLSSVGMLEHCTKLPRQMSGGQRQRVAIARAFVHKPDLILADEPTANLDRSYVSQVMDLIGELQRDHKTTVVLATHDEEVYQRADGIFRIQGGHLT